MAYILPGRESAGSKFGSGLGQGFSASMQAIAQNKLQQMQQNQQYEQTYKWLKNYFPEKGAALLAQMSPQERSAVFNNISLPKDWFVQSQQGQQGGMPQQQLLPQELMGTQQQPAQRNQLQEVLQQLQSPYGAANLLASTGLGQQQAIPQAEFEPQQQPFAPVQVQPKPVQQAEQELFRPFEKPQERQARELLELKKEKATRESQRELKPFLTGEAQDLKNAKAIYQKAKSMRDNLETHKKEFPQGIGSFKPHVLIRNPHVRKYVADANTLVTLLAGSRKGQPTNYKIRLEQLSKPELTQPIPTQLELLNDTIASAEEVFKRDELIRNIKKENKGLYPADLIERIAESESRSINEDKAAQRQYVAEFESEPSPKEFVGKKVEFPDGSIRQSNGKQWVRI